MSTEVKVALIAAAAVFVQVVVSYLINRQRANDLRTNIDREVDIIRKLRADSPEAVRLESHVKASIDKLITRDERREQIGDLLRSTAPLPVLCFAISGLLSWRERGIPESIEFAVTAVFWALFGVLAALVLNAIARAGLVVFAGVRVWFTSYRLKAATRRQLREGKQMIVTERRKAEQIIGIFYAHKEEIIEKLGQEKWDELTTVVDGLSGTLEHSDNELDRLARDLKNIKPVKEFLRNYSGQKLRSQKEETS